MLQILPDKHLTHGLQKTRYFDVSLGGGRWVFVPLGHATGVKKQNKTKKPKPKQGRCAATAGATDKLYTNTWNQKSGKRTRMATQ